MSFVRTTYLKLGSFLTAAALLGACDKPSPKVSSENIPQQTTSTPIDLEEELTWSEVKALNSKITTDKTKPVDGDLFLTDDEVIIHRDKITDLKEVVSFAQNNVKAGQFHVFVVFPNTIKDKRILTLNMTAHDPNFKLENRSSLHVAKLERYDQKNPFQIVPLTKVDEAALMLPFTDLNLVRKSEEVITCSRFSENGEPTIFTVSRKNAEMIQDALFDDGMPDFKVFPKYLTRQTSDINRSRSRSQ